MGQAGREASLLPSPLSTDWVMPMRLEQSKLLYSVHWFSANFLWKYPQRDAQKYCFASPLGTVWSSKLAPKAHHPSSSGKGECVSPAEGIVGLPGDGCEAPLPSTGSPLQNAKAFLLGLHGGLPGSLPHSCRCLFLQLFLFPRFPCSPNFLRIGNILILRIQYIHSGFLEVSLGLPGVEMG